MGLLTGSGRRKTGLKGGSGGRFAQEFDRGLLQLVKTTQAVIQFTPEGTIIDANEAGVAVRLIVEMLHREARTWRAFRPAAGAMPPPARSPPELHARSLCEKP